MYRFTPGPVGSTLAVVSGGRALLVRFADDPATIERLWLAVSAGESLQSILDVLTAQGLSKTPAFALVGADSDETALNCIVRGDIALHVGARDGEHPIDAARATTWVETRVSGVQTFSAGSVGSGTSLPMMAGAVWASSLSWIAGGSVSVAAVPQSAPAVASAPAPAAVSAPIESEHTITAQTVTGAFLDEVASEGAASESAYDRLFAEETVMRSIEDAAVRPPGEDEHAEAPEPSTGDHDGMTVLTSDIAKLRSGRKSKASRPVDAPPPAPRYLLELSTGATEALDGTAIIGRAPSVSKVSGGTVPKLIAIPGNQDISRNHVQFTVEGDTVVVTDMQSRNGTTIVLPGKSPQLLRQGEAASVLVGTLVDLGGGVTITVGHE